MAVSTIERALAPSDVVNNLTSTATDRPLSAAQGKALNDNFSNIGSTASTARATTSRGTLLSGGAYLAGKLLILQFTFKAVVSATNSPGILATDKTLPCDAALSAIDITSGMASAITSSVPCGISTIGQVFIKELVTDHIYAISGVVRCN